MATNRNEWKESRDIISGSIDEDKSFEQKVDASIRLSCQPDFASRREPARNATGLRAFSSDSLIGVQIDADDIEESGEGSGPRDGNPDEMYIDTTGALAEEVRKSANRNGTSAYATSRFGSKGTGSDNGSITSVGRSTASLDDLDLVYDEDIWVDPEDADHELRSGFLKYRRFSCKKMLGRCIIAALFVSGVVAIGMGVLGKDSSAPSDYSDPEEIEESETKKLFELILSTGVTDRETLRSAESPQSMAFDWVDEYYTGTESDWKTLQRYAMATLFFANDGDNWINADDWLSDKDECDWFSRNEEPCDDSGALMSLSLDQNGLSGSLPSELGLLSSLREVNLKGMGGKHVLSGSLSMELSRWTELRVLDLSSNHFVGAIDDELIKSWSKLEQFEVSFNRFRGPLPASIGSLANLEHAHLSDNNFNGTIPQSYGSTDAISIDLHGNELVGPVPAGKWPNLHVLRISMNRLSSFASPVSAPMLKKLHVSKNRMDGALPDLDTSPHLEIVEVDENLFEGPIPSSWENLSFLKHLDVSNNLLSGDLPELLTASGALETLHAEGNSFGRIVCPATQPVDWSADCRPVKGTRETECPCCTSCCWDGASCHSTDSSGSR